MRLKLETVVGFFIILAVSIFLYISFKIGSWRMDTIRYANYIAYFSDVSGLNEKSDVMISGVKVGWLNKITLVNKNKQVRLDFMIDKNCIIYANAHALIRQNGILGTKYIEIISGDPIYSILPIGSTLMQPNKPAVSIDELISTFKDIADNVNSVTASLKEIVGGSENTKSLIGMVENAQKAFKSFEIFAEVTNSMVQKNDKNINNICDNLSSIINQIKDVLPKTINDLDSGVSQISESITRASNNINETVNPVRNVFNKIDNGKGILGTLISDEDLMKDLRETLDVMKHYHSYMRRLSISIDSHIESMHGSGNDLNFKDAKGYFNLKIRPADDFYYLLGVTSSYFGDIKRLRTDRLWFDQRKHEMVPDNMELDDWTRLKYAPVKEEFVREYGKLTFNLQFAKEFCDLCFRLGIFESTFGFGIDYKLPFNEDFRWMTTFEMFRFNEFMSHTVSGRVVSDIDMPHMKWYNSVFFNDSLYFVFGLDDFISKFNKNFFVGMGLFFEQDDVKYLASKVVS